MPTPTYTELTASLGDQVVDAVKQAEERTVAALASATDLASSFLPSVPSIPVPEGVPSARDVVEANAALVERVLEAQTAFVVSVLDSLPKVGGSETPRKRAAKAA